MTPRSIRRAAERKALKIARKAVATETPIPATLSHDPGFTPESSNPSVYPDARAAANRANALFSTGPRTPGGKSISSLNAVKTGLTGRTVLLASDDVIAYTEHIAAYEKEFQPIGFRERELVQSLADTAWRLDRIPRLEMAIYAQGRLEFEASLEEHHPDLRPAMIELQTFLKYEKQLRNLQLQESRLRRHFSKDSAELRSLQEQRQSESLPDFSAFEPRASATAGSSFGFEFSAATSANAPDRAVAVAVAVAAGAISPQPSHDHHGEAA